MPSASVTARRSPTLLTAAALALSTAATGAVIFAPGAQAAGETYRMTVLPSPYRSSDGTVWAARTGFDGGDFSPSYSSGTIRGASDSRLYYPELVRFRSWSKPVENGTYRVTLKMREQWWTRPGQRVFDVTAEGRTALANVDIVAAVGKDAAYDRTFDVPVTDGRLDLGFVWRKDSALLSALQVTRLGAATPAPTPTPSPTPSPTPMPTPSPIMERNAVVISLLMVNQFANRGSSNMLIPTPARAVMMGSPMAMTEPNMNNRISIAAMIP